MELLPVFFIGLSVCWYALEARALFQLSQPSRLQQLLAVIFVWWSFSTLKDMALYVPGIEKITMLRHIFYIDGFGAVTFALFLMEIVKPGWTTLKRATLLSIPYLLFFLLHFFVQDGLLDTAFTFFFVCFAWTTFLIGIYKNRAYARAIREHYSNLEDVDISRVWGILAAFFICQHVWWAVSGMLDALADAFYYVISLICWGLTLRCVNRLRSLRLPEKENEAEEQGSGAESLNESVPASRKRLSNLASALTRLMEEERSYLNPDITVSELALKIGTNRTYLSEYFSTDLGMTFYDYINRLRIKHSVLPMMKSGDNYSLDYIAKQSGFKSISTFRRSFLKFTGKLPSEYLRDES
ncbi:MAG: helix-turn-helix transcriptional regulator [Prevotella sp.]|nr:helix-turn-helix transcriptional regulator [Prevotella sp.]